MDVNPANSLQVKKVIIINPIVIKIANRVPRIFDFIVIILD